MTYFRYERAFQKANYVPNKKQWQASTGTFGTKQDEQGASFCRDLPESWRPGASSIARPYLLIPYEFVIWFLHFVIYFMIFC